MFPAQMNNQASLAAALKAAQAAQGGASDAPIGVTDTMVGGAFTHVLENRRFVCSLCAFSCFDSLLKAVSSVADQSERLRPSVWRQRPQQRHKNQRTKPLQQLWHAQIRR